MEDGVITNVKPEQINAASIDLTLGPKIMEEIFNVHCDPTLNGMVNVSIGEAISLGARTPLPMREVECIDGYDLKPGEFILAHSQQIFNLPNNISAEYKLKSSMARIGLEHLNAGWCDAGWTGSALTLELKNMTQLNTIRIKHGDAIGQIVFFEHEPVPADRSYAARGRYNNDTTVTGVKK